MRDVRAETIEEEQRYSISEAAILFDRAPHTLRSWDRSRLIPEELRPYRDEKGYRYWTLDLINRTKRWMKESGFYPGNGIVNYHPSESQLEKHIDKIRLGVHSNIRRMSRDMLEFRSYLISEKDKGISDDRLLEKIPEFVKGANFHGSDISLSEALEVAASVIDGRA